MRKVGLIVFLSLLIIFSSTVMAATWINTNWINEVTNCGGYNSSCNMCTGTTVSGEQSRTFMLPQGRWLIDMYADNIQALETKCCANTGCSGNPDCSGQISYVGVIVSVDGNSIFQSSDSGTWLYVDKHFGGCGDLATPTTLSQIFGEKEVYCGNSPGCQIQYKWTLGMYGYAHGFDTGEYIYGKASLDARVDYQQMFDFSLSANPSSGTVTQGSNTNTTISATLIGGSTQSVSFTAYGLPSGASASFSSMVCSPTCQTNMTISTTTSTPTGQYLITINATGGGITRSTTYQLTVNQRPPFDFSLSVDPSSGTVNKGGSVNSNVTAKLISGDTQPVSLSYYIQPQSSGINVNFNPTSLTPTSAGVNSTMTISADSTASPGTYTITVVGTAGSLTRTATYTLTIPSCTRSNPTISVAPSTQSGTAGSTLQYTVTVGNADSGNDCTRQDFTLSSACPGSWTCTFILPSLSVAPGSTNATILNVTSPTTATGSNSFNVIATSGSYTNITSATYSISSPCSGPVKLTLTPSTISPSGSVTPSASGLSNCDGKKVEFRNNSCTGVKIGECIVSGAGCASSPLTAPGFIGSYTYFACIDMNGDSDFGDNGEVNSTILTVANVCPRDNPTLTSDITSTLRGAGEIQTFKITVKNEDYESCSDSTFKLSVACPGSWTCTFDKSSMTISPKDSVSANLTIKSAIGSTGQHSIDVTAVSLSDSTYNKTLTLGFNIGSKCDSASIKIDDVSFLQGNMKISVENNGTSNGLAIKSVIITDTSNKQYVNSSISAGSLDSGDSKEIVLTKNIPACENFSKLVVNTDCTSVSGAFDQKARCLSTSNTIVKIKSARYESGTVKAVLTNDGSDSISSDAIGITLGDQTVSCKEAFILSAKSTANCSIDFECSDTVKMAITSPNKNETEVNCKPEINITPNTCKDAGCSQYSAVFGKGDSVYLDVKTDPSVDVSASVYYNGEFQERIYPGQPYKPANAGIYTINITASKEGYTQVVKKLTFTVVDNTSGLVVKVGLIVVFVLILAAFIFYRLRKTKKRQGFDELYEKYKKKQAYGELYRKYGRRRRRVS
jgi:hypothetical protein